MKRIDHFHKNKDIISLINYLDKLRKKNKKISEKISILQNTFYTEQDLQELKKLYQTKLLLTKEINYGNVILANFF